MTTTFDKREEGFEKQFAHDEELRFKAMARRNKMLGLWAAGVLGKSGADAEAYAKDVVLADFEEAGDNDVLHKVLRDLQPKGFTEQQIRAQMTELLAQAVAQMLTRVGIKTNVDAMTASTFFSRRNKYEFSLYLAGWGADSGEMINPLVALVATMDPKTGMGHTNRGRYSNPELDALIKEAQTTVDDAKREAILRKASKLAMSDTPLVPLHFEVTPWALKKGLTGHLRLAVIPTALPFVTDLTTPMRLRYPAVRFTVYSMNSDALLEKLILLGMDPSSRTV